MDDTSAPAAAAAAASTTTTDAMVAPVLPPASTNEPKRSVADLAPTEGPLSVDETLAWRTICKRRPPPPEGRPSPELIKALKDFKADLKAFIATLSPNQAAYVRNLDKKIDKERKVAAKKKKKANNQKSQSGSKGKGKAKKSKAEREEERAAREIARQEKQQQARLKQKRQQALSKVKSNKLTYDAVAGWLEIRCKFLPAEADPTFEVTLPQWLARRDEFMERAEADDVMLLEVHELEDFLVQAAKELSVAYFGAGFEFDPLFSELKSIVESNRQIGKREGLPPWVRCVSDQLSPDEMELACSALTDHAPDDGDEQSWDDTDESDSSSSDGTSSDDSSDDDSSDDE